MRIGVIQATSQRERNEALYRCTCQAVARGGRGDAVVNYGVLGDEDASFSYVEAALNACLLLGSGAVDFIVTGCASGQGMMLAMNSLPGVLCGFVQTPQDAYLFGRINGGNAVSLPLGLNFGWQGEIGLQCTLDKLFDGEFGCGFPPEEAERKRRDAEAVKRLNRLSRRPLAEVLVQCDRQLVARTLQWRRVREDILERGRNREIVELVRSMANESPVE